MHDNTRPSRSMLDVIHDQLEAGENPLVVFATDQRGTDLDFTELAGDEK